MSIERKPWRVPDGWIEPVERKKDPNPYKQLLYEIELNRRVMIMREKELERDRMWREMMSEDQVGDKIWREIVG